MTSSCPLIPDELYATYYSDIIALDVFFNNPVSINLKTLYRSLTFSHHNRKEADAGSKGIDSIDFNDVMKDNMITSLITATRVSNVGLVSWFWLHERNSRGDETCNKSFHINFVVPIVVKFIKILSSCAAMIVAEDYRQLSNKKTH